MNFFRYLRFKRNKVLALFFSGLGLALFGAYYLIAEILVDWRLFSSNPLGLFSFFLYLVAYLIIVVANARNDNMAYRGIFMFVFFTFFSCLLDLLPGTRNYFAVYGTGNPLLITFVTIYIAFAIAQFVIGLLLYIKIFRYAAYRSDNFRAVRLFSILYAAILAGCVGFQLVVFLLANVLTPLGIAIAFFIPLSEVFVAVAIVFTLERLRRL